MKPHTNNADLKFENLALHAACKQAAPSSYTASIPHQQLSIVYPSIRPCIHEHKELLLSHFMLLPILYSFFFVAGLIFYNFCCYCCFVWFRLFAKKRWSSSTTFRIHKQNKEQRESVLFRIHKRQTRFISSLLCCCCCI